MDAQALFARMMKERVAPAWRRLGLRGSGNAFRLPNDAGHYALIGVQRDKWNTAQRCAFTLNVSFISAQEWATAQVVQPWIDDAPNANAHTPGVGWWQRVGYLVAGGYDHWWLVQTCDDRDGCSTASNGLGRRGHRDDPLYRIRRLLTTARENLTDRGRARLEAALRAGDPGLEVTVAWHAHQDLRSMFRAPSPAAGRAVAQRVLDSFHRCPIPEVARLGRTLRLWRSEVLAYFDDDPARYGISNGGTEAINLIIEKTRRLAHGFRNFGNYRIRILLAADGTRLWRRRRRGSG